MAEHHVLKLDLDAAKDELVRVALVWEAHPDQHGTKRAVKLAARRVRDLQVRWEEARSAVPKVDL